VTVSPGPRIELVYDRDCPNVDRTRQQIRDALRRAGLPPEWREWDRGAAESPPYVRSYASPTVLVDGRDITAAPGTRDATLDGADGAAGCRVYSTTAGEMSGVPPLEAILVALETGPRE
jgi:mercuric ion transport protein